MQGTSSEIISTLTQSSAILFCSRSASSRAKRSFSSQLACATDIRNLCRYRAAFDVPENANAAVTAKENARCRTRSGFQDVPGNALKRQALCSHAPSRHTLPSCPLLFFSARAPPLLVPSALAPPEGGERLGDVLSRPPILVTLRRLNGGREKLRLSPPCVPRCKLAP